MEKLIFKKVIKDITLLFFLLCLTLGLIVWTLQAVNYLDFVTQDGHGLKTYFFYILYNFPKIIHRLIPFVFFISLFLVLTNYEAKNELVIFWTHGVSKMQFANIIIILSIILLVIQILIGSYISPVSQLKSRTFLKDSNIDYFSSLIKEGKFINAVKGLTIFIDKKDQDGNFKNIYIDDSSKENTKITYANNGKILDINNKKIFKLFNGKVINKKKNKINVFEFDQIDFNLSDYTTKTILTPKLQETSTKNLIVCFFSKFNFEKKNEKINCQASIKAEISQELFKRIYKPIYIPILALICSFLILLPKNNSGYKLQSSLTFLFGFLLLIISETALRYSTVSTLSTGIYLITPFILFIIIYLILFKKSKNV